MTIWGGRELRPENSCLKVPEGLVAGTAIGSQARRGRSVHRLVGQPGEEKTKVPSATCNQNGRIKDKWFYASERTVLGGADELCT